VKYLLDTNVISETTKKQPNQGVVNFFEQTDALQLYISVLTLGELRKGIEKLITADHKKQKLTQWLDIEMATFFRNRILAIDAVVADKWGFILGNLKNSAPAVDSLLAATAISNNLKLVTRNVSDFKAFQVEIINPWGA